MKHAALIVTSLAALAVAAAMAPAWAQSARDEVLDSAARCAGIADDRTWLDCYYGAAQPMRGRLGLSPAPAAQIRLVPPAGAGAMAGAPAYRRQPPPPREKGFFGELLGSIKPVVSDMPMASYNFGPDGRFTIRLQNGQVYQQEENDLVHAGWSGPPESLLVTIQPAGDKYTVRVKSDRGRPYRARRR